MKKDPYKHEEKYNQWKEAVKDGIPGISKVNSEIVMNYMLDMEYGLNVASSSKKGGRSYIRLNNLRQRIIFLIKQFEERYGKTNIAEITERELHDYFIGMKNGTVRRQDGGKYQSPVDYIKVVKAFWHWHQKVNRKKGIKVEDITVDLDTSKEKPKWVYLTEEQVRRLVKESKSDYAVLIMFLFDTGIRAPTELVNIKVSDFHNGFKELTIRDEISKTFGRRIKLMLCSELIKDFVKEQGLEEDDYIFTKHPRIMNRYLKRLAIRVFGDQQSLAGQKYSELTMYDFRHCSCCYWMTRYKSESALKFRFGWKKSDKIHYYSEMLGMKDDISDDDMLVDVTKTELENKLKKSDARGDILEERVVVLERQIKMMAEMVRESRLIVREC